MPLVNAIDGRIPTWPTPLVKFGGVLTTDAPLSTTVVVNDIVALLLDLFLFFEAFTECMDVSLAKKKDVKSCLVLSHISNTVRYVDLLHSLKIPAVCMHLLIACDSEFREVFTTAPFWTSDGVANACDGRLLDFATFSFFEPELDGCRNTSSFKVS